jgi:DNA-binding CsgD family transcriptional regulator
VFPELASVPNTVLMNPAQPRPLPPTLASTPIPSEQPAPQDQTADVIPLRGRQGKISQLSGRELSGRELQVLQLTAEGLTNAEIGKMLFLSQETVKSHLRNLLAKLQVRNRTHAVGLGFRLRLIA